MKRRLALLRLYKTLRESFGHRGWWPGDTPEEVVIGAILTQQTSWKNAEKAINGLKKANLISLGRISVAGSGLLESHIISSGYYRQKARILKGFSAYVIDNYGSLENFFGKDLPGLREELLTIKGIGPETADSMLLYAAEKPVFVIDAYTKRIMHRIYGTDPEIKYGKLQELIRTNIPVDINLYNDFHAQFVELGKRYCRKKPLCDMCPARLQCSYYKASFSNK